MITWKSQGTRRTATHRHLSLPHLGRLYIVSSHCIVKMRVAGLSCLMSVDPDHDCGKLVMIRREDDMPNYDGTQGPKAVSGFWPVFSS